MSLHISYMKARIPGIVNEIDVKKMAENESFERQK